MNIAPRLLSPGELAARWSVSTRAILDLCKSGRLAHVRINARVIRISETDAALFYACATRHNSTQLPIVAGEASR